MLHLLWGKEAGERRPQISPVLQLCDCSHPYFASSQINTARLAADLMSIKILLNVPHDWLRISGSTHGAITHAACNYNDHCHYCTVKSALYLNEFITVLQSGLIGNEHPSMVHSEFIQRSLSLLAFLVTCVFWTSETLVWGKWDIREWTFFSASILTQNSRVNTGVTVILIKVLFYSGQTESVCCHCANWNNRKALQL